MSDLARLERRLNQAVDRFERIEARLGAATDGAEIVKLGQEHAELKPLVEAIDDDFAVGTYGLATLATAAQFDDFTVTQP